MGYFVNTQKFWFFILFLFFVNTQNMENYKSKELPSPKDCNGILCFS